MAITTFPHSVVQPDVSAESATPISRPALDVGRGPAKVILDLLPFFGRGVGIDFGHEMNRGCKDQC